MIPTSATEIIVAQSDFTFVSIFILLVLLLISVTATIAMYFSKSTGSLNTLQIVLDASPLSCFILDEKLNVLDLNQATLILSKAKSKQEFIKNFANTVPEYQSDGSLSMQKIKNGVLQAVKKGSASFEWLAMTADGECYPAEIHATAVPQGNSHIIIVYMRDLRDYYKGLEAQASSDTKLKFIAKVNHEIRTPMIADADAVSALHNSAQSVIPKPYFDGGEILVVDDNNQNLRVTCEHLKRLGLSCFISKDGADAVRLVENRVNTGKKPFDMIFMDIHMPGTDGLEAASVISRLSARTPIIAMTADSISPANEVLYMNSGMTGFISKPYTTQELWKCLLKYLKL
ncbi:MAG: response regulator [Defluviitaleaceae bacterium]|nr:response regulator [Defluviitaleaceae bacterium]